MSTRGGSASSRQDAGGGEAHPPVRRRWWRTEQFEGIAFVLPFALVWLVFLVWPVIYGFYISLWEWDPLRGSEFVGFDNYLRLFRTERFWNAFVNTFEFALISIPLIVGLGLLFAVLLDRRDFPGKNLIEAGLFFPYLLNVSIVGLVWLWLMDSDFGIVVAYLQGLGLDVAAPLKDSVWALPVIAIATAWWLSGYRMVIFRAALRDIPDSLLEMAELDGANAWRRFVHIVLPLIKPSILFAVVLTAISGFRVLGQVLIMTAGGPGRASEVLALYLYRLGFHHLDLGLAAAVGVILFLIILVVSLIAFRFLGLESEFERRGGGA